MRNFRATFHDGPMGNISKAVDFKAEDMDQAFGLALKMPEASDRRFSEVSVEEIAEGLKNIGLEINYFDTAIRRQFRDCLIIRAYDEDEAVRYYNKFLRGGRFWFYANKTEPDGKCQRGDVIRAYYAACPGYHFDATKGKELVLG